MSGLLAAIRLEEAGIPYVVIEKNEGGGRHLVRKQLSGLPGRLAQPLLLLLLRAQPRLAAIFLAPRRTASPISTAAWTSSEFARTSASPPRWPAPATREDEQVWNVALKTKDGKEETIKVNALITAVGQLNRPEAPRPPGPRDVSRVRTGTRREWQHQHDLKGKTVAVIGTGASAFQIVPEVAKVAGTVKVFQRSAPWIVP